MMQKYLVEFIGSFFLTLVILLTHQPLAEGAILIALFYAGFALSGANFNPAISIALILRKAISIPVGLSYMLSQMLGSLTGAMIAINFTGKSFVPSPPVHSGNLPPFLAEIIFTALIVFVYLRIFEMRVKALGMGSLAMGFVLMASVFAAGPISGAVFNPSFGVGCILADVFNGGNSLSLLGLYIAGPFVGSVVGIILFTGIQPESPSVQRQDNT